MNVKLSKCFSFHGIIFDAPPEVPELKPKFQELGHEIFTFEIYNTITLFKNMQTQPKKKHDLGAYAYTRNTCNKETKTTSYLLYLSKKPVIGRADMTLEGSPLTTLSTYGLTSS